MNKKKASSTDFQKMRMNLLIGDASLSGEEEHHSEAKQGHGSLEESISA